MCKKAVLGTTFDFCPDTVRRHDMIFRLGPNGGLWGGDKEGDVKFKQYDVQVILL